MEIHFVLDSLFFGPNNWICSKNLVTFGCLDQNPQFFLLEGVYFLSPWKLEILLVEG